jgi:hypothetical protein
VRLVEERTRAETAIAISGDGGEPGRLGVICAAGRAEDAASLIDRLRDLAAREDADIVAFGATSDDCRVMMAGRVFVTGAVARDDLPALMRHYGVSRLVFAEQIVAPAQAQASQPLPPLAIAWPADDANADAEPTPIDPAIARALAERQPTGVRAHD